MSSVRNQYVVSAIVSLFTLTYGVAMAWPSSSILVLMSDETPLESGKITLDEASWIASLTNIGGMIGNMCHGFITKKFGRKKPLLFLSIPTFLSWMLILYAKDVYALYFARFVAGLVGSSNTVVTPLFLSEIANDRNRGIIASTLVLSVNFGQALAFILGYFCHYYTTPKFIIVIITLFTILMALFPETPTFLVKQNRKSEAKKSIRFYRNLQKHSVSDNEILQQELMKLEKACGVRKSETFLNRKMIKWSDLNTKVARKALVIGLVLSALNQCSGCFAMMSYTAMIFEEAGTALSSNVSAIIVGLIQFVGIGISMNLIDRAGRKFLYMISTFGMAFGLITFGVYMQLKSLDYNVETFNWIPLASFSFILFIGSWAVSSLPFVITAEIMPEQLKEFGISVCMTFLWLLAFLMVKFMPLLTEAIELHRTFYLFAGVCISGALFVIFYVPELEENPMSKLWIHYDENFNIFLNGHTSTSL